MEPHVITLPKWVFVIRIVQALLALVVLGLSAYGIYWVPYSAWCFALYQSLATLIIVGYNLLTVHVASCKPAYNYWAVLGLDIYAIIFWLASMAGLAAKRSAFRIHTSITSCYNDGYGGVCIRDLAKRDVATYGYLNMISASAGVSAIEMLLFIATLVIFSINLRRYRSERSPAAPVTNDKLEAQSVPMNPVQYQQQQQQQQQYPPQQQYAPTQQYSSPQETQYTPTPPPQQTYSPPPQQQYSMPAQPYHQAPEPVSPPPQHAPVYHQAPEVAHMQSPHTTGPQ